MRPAKFPVLLFALFVLGNAAMCGSALAAGDAKKGEAIFTTHCALCHVAARGGGNGLGPNLFGVAGRKAASLPDFNYSHALSTSGIVWDNARLTAWVQGPAKLVHGTQMFFGGLTDPHQADDVVAYLDSLK